MADYTGDITDALAINDAIVTGGGDEYNVAVADDITVNDALFIEQDVNIIDALNLNDSVTCITEYNDAVTDNITFTDILSTSNSDFSTSVTDALALNDTIVFIKETEKTIADTIALNESTDAFNWTQFLKTEGRCQTYYYFKLTHDGCSDLYIPIESFQGRMNSDSPSYLSVVIPNVVDYVDDIIERIDTYGITTMVIEMAYVKNNIEEYRSTLCWVDLEDIRTDRGANNQSITLSGHKTFHYDNKNETLTGVSYRSLQANGKLLFRCSPPNLHLRPGYQVTYGDDTIIISNISYNVSLSAQTQEITEA